MSRPAPVATMSYADYIALEASGAAKHEFLPGAVFAMAGGTPEHAALEAAVAWALRTELERAGRPCRVHSANLRVRVEQSISRVTRT